MLNSLAILAMGEAELHRFLLDEAERNPCIELTYPDRNTQFPAATAALSDAPSGLETALGPQITLLFQDPDARRLAWLLTLALDDSGWLTCPLEDIATHNRCHPEALRPVLERLKTGVQPVGLFGQSLREVLQLQLQDREALTPLVQGVLDHLELLADGKVERVAQLCGVTRRDVLDTVRLLQTLDPKPGERFGLQSVPTQVPDLLLNVAGREMSVQFNRRSTPTISVVSPDYAQFDEQGIVFLTRARQTAIGLRRAVARRDQTTLQIASALVACQGDYLCDGKCELAPLTLAELAIQLQMHPSTVSRATTDRMIDTPRGAVTLKSLFSRKTKSHVQPTSLCGLRQTLRQLIADEDPARPLSDAALERQLAQMGHTVSRRSIADHRRSCDIPNAAQRRVQACLTDKPARTTRKLTSS